jgi:hypothetical protein
MDEEGDGKKRKRKSETGNEKAEGERKEVKG